MSKPMKKSSKKDSASKPKASEVASNMEELDALIVELNDKREQSKAITERISELQHEVLAEMDRLDIESRRVLIDGGVKRLNAKKVVNKSTVLNQTALKKRLKAKLWDKVSVRSLDRKKLDAAIADGSVSLADVEACATEKLSSPFIRIS